MELLNDNVKKLFFKYFGASFGSAMIMAVYTIVDSAMIGHYEGYNGVAALATVSPLWSLIFSLGLLFGIGGAVLMSNNKGAGNMRRGNEYFTVAFIGALGVTLLVWAGIVIFIEEILVFCGADEVLLVLGLRYMKTVKIAVPCFIFGQFLASFLRNDNAPKKATVAVLVGGIINIFGDYFCVYTLDLGIFGAGLATAIGQLVGLMIMLSHFFSKKCSLHLVMPRYFWRDLANVVGVGFSAFFVDVALGIMAILFNKQIMYYANASALAVYGVIVDVTILAQSCAYGIGQAAQPIISANLGAKKFARVKEVHRCALWTVFVITIVCVVVVCGYPLVFINLFMSADSEVLRIAPKIMRLYCSSYILLLFNIYCTYYLQAIMKAKEAFVLSILRGFVICAILIYVLPYLFGIDALWLSMLLTEIVVSVIAILFFINGKKRKLIEKNG